MVDFSDQLVEREKPRRQLGIWHSKAGMMHFAIHEQAPDGNSVDRAVIKLSIIENMTIPLDGYVIILPVSNPVSAIQLST
jgi:hypothetical protein